MEISKVDMTKQRSDLNLPGLQVSFYGIPEHKEVVLREIFIKARHLVPHWIERLTVSELDNDVDGAVAQVTAHISYRFADIKIFPRMWSNTRTPEEMYWVLVHEILHIPIHQIVKPIQQLVDNYFDDGPAKDFIKETIMSASEATVCDLTRSLQEFEQSILEANHDK